MARQRESGLQLRIQKHLRAEFPDCYVLKVHVSDFTPAGTPDLICCIQGYFFGLEVKEPGSQPNKLQQHELKRIRLAGGLAAVVTSPAEAVMVVRTALRRVSCAAG